MKLYHVQLTNPYQNEIHFYFGSQAAIFDYFPKGVLGKISLRSLVNNSDLTKKEYINKYCTIRLGEKISKKGNRGQWSVNQRTINLNPNNMNLEQYRQVSIIIDKIIKNHEPSEKFDFAPMMKLREEDRHEEANKITVDNLVVITSVIRSQAVFNAMIELKKELFVMID